MTFVFFFPLSSLRTLPPCCNPAVEHSVYSRAALRACSTAIDLPPRPLREASHVPTLCPRQVCMYSSSGPSSQRPGKDQTPGRMKRRAPHVRNVLYCRGREKGNGKVKKRKRERLRSTAFQDREGRPALPCSVLRCTGRIYGRIRRTVDEARLARFGCRYKPRWCGLLFYERRLAGRTASGTESRRFVGGQDGRGFWLMTPRIRLSFLVSKLSTY